MDLDFHARDFAEFKRAGHQYAIERKRIPPVQFGRYRLYIVTRAHGSKPYREVRLLSLTS
ncbi:MAG: hypothetical protein ACLQFI_18930 [Methylocella sp.]|jgi:hypothetical protein